MVDIKLGAGMQIAGDLAGFAAIWIVQKQLVYKAQQTQQLTNVRARRRLLSNPTWLRLHTDRSRSLDHSLALISVLVQKGERERSLMDTLRPPRL